MERALFKIAVQKNFQLPHRKPDETFSARWVRKIEELGHEARLVDAFEEDFFAQVSGCDGFMFWFPPIPVTRNLGKNLMLALSHVSDVVPFPDWKSCWHFDDKVAQSYLLDAAGIPTPKTWVFWNREQALEFCRAARYPLVIKLSSGVYSQNVDLLRDRKDAEFQICRLFGSGIKKLENRPNSVVRAARRKARHAVQAMKHSSEFDYLGQDVHRDYILLQEFVPDNDFDTRITIIGNRAFGCRRMNRLHDFRASGSGILDTDHTRIEEDAIRLGFLTARALDAPSLCMDVLRQNGKPVLNEISYFYPSHSITILSGHWELSGEAETGKLKWVEGVVRAEDALLDDFLILLESRQLAHLKTT